MTGVVALLAPAAAQAATLTTDAPCYRENKPITVTGTGFTPGATYSATLNNDQLPNDVVRSDGTISRPLLSDQLDADQGEVVYTLEVNDGTNDVITRFTVTAVTAAFSPTEGSLKTLKVRFQVFGFGVSATSPVTVYLHYVAPNGKLARTITLGPTQGDCGKIPNTRQRLLFPFSAGTGDWRLQFDAHKQYTRGTTKSTFPYVTRVLSIQDQSKACKKTTTKKKK